MMYWDSYKSTWSRELCITLWPPLNARTKWSTDPPWTLYSAAVFSSFLQQTKWFHDANLKEKIVIQCFFSQGQIKKCEGAVYIPPQNHSQVRQLGNLLFPCILLLFCPIAITEKQQGRAMDPWNFFWKHLILKLIGHDLHLFPRKD